jgi:hypothetical protein
VIDTSGAGLMSGGGSMRGRPVSKH